MQILPKHIVYAHHGQFGVHCHCSTSSSYMRYHGRSCDEAICCTQPCTAATRRSEAVGTRLTPLPHHWCVTQHGASSLIQNLKLTRPCMETFNTDYLVNSPFSMNEYIPGSGKLHSNWILAVSARKPLMGHIISCEVGNLRKCRWDYATNVSI